MRTVRAGGWAPRGRGRADVGFLRSEAVIDGHFATVDQVGIFGIGRSFAVLFDADGMPVVEGNLAIHAAAVHAGGTGILLAAAEAIGEGVVSGDVIHGGGGLGVPVAPGRAAVGGDDAALVADQQDDVRVGRVDPALLVIVAAGCAADGGPGEARVFRAPEDCGAAVDHVWVLGIDGDGGEIAAADAAEGAIVGGVAASGAGFEDAGIIGGERPMLTAVGGLVEGDVAAAAAAGSASIGARGGAGLGRGAAGSYGGVNDFRVAGGDGEIRLNDGRESACEFLPGGAAICRFIDAAIGTAEGSVLIEALLLLPESGVKS